jgi:hypothetical protein
LQKQTHRPKIAKELTPCHSKGKLFFFKYLTLKFLKQLSRTTSRKKNRNNKMTKKAQKYNDLKITVERRPAYNITYTHAGVFCIDTQKSAVFEV